MGAYDRFKSAEVMGARNYILEGEHIFFVKRMEQSMSKNPKTPGIEKSLVEFKIIQSTSMRPGQFTSLVEMSNQAGYLGNVLAVTAGILGYDIDKFRDDPDFDSVFDGAWGTQQILHGFLVGCIAQNSTTSKGGTYTNKTWEPILASDYPNFNFEAPDGAYTGEVEAE